MACEVCVYVGVVVLFLPSCLLLVAMHLRAAPVGHWAAVQECCLLLKGSFSVQNDGAKYERTLLMNWRGMLQNECILSASQCSSLQSDGCMLLQDARKQLMHTAMCRCRGCPEGSREFVGLDMCHCRLVPP